MRFMIPVLFGCLGGVVMDICNIELFSMEGLLVGAPFWLLGALICEVAK